MFLAHRLAAWRAVFALQRFLTIIPVVAVTGIWYVLSALPIVLLAFAIWTVLNLSQQAFFPLIAAATCLHIVLLAPIYLSIFKEFFTGYLACVLRMIGRDVMAQSQLNRAELQSKEATANV